jgi:hypothetical protein
LVSRTFAFQGVYGSAVALSRFRHKHISPSAARMWNKFQPFRSGLTITSGVYKTFKPTLRKSNHVHTLTSIAFESFEIDYFCTKIFNQHLL